MEFYNDHIIVVCINFQNEYYVSNLRCNATDTIRSQGDVSRGQVRALQLGA